MSFLFKLNSAFLIDDKKYDSTFELELDNLNLSVDFQFLSSQEDNKQFLLKPLQFRQNFEKMSAKFTEPKLQAIWDMVFNTKMMQDFVIEDVFHHYFFKRYPSVSLSDFFKFNVINKTISVSVVDFPSIIQKGELDYFYLPVGLSISESNDHQVSQTILHKLFASKYTSQFYSTQNQKMLIDKNNLDSSDDYFPDKNQMFFVEAKGSYLTYLVSSMINDFEINLNSISQINSMLTLKNLKLVFPHLSSFYGSDESIINLRLKVDIQSNN